MFSKYLNLFQFSFHFFHLSAVIYLIYRNVKQGSQAPFFILCIMTCSPYHHLHVGVGELDDTLDWINFRLNKPRSQKYYINILRTWTLLLFHAILKGELPSYVNKHGSKHVFYKQISMWRFIWRRVDGVKSRENTNISDDW